MLDFIVIPALFSWMTHCVLLHNVKTRLHNKGYKYTNDPRSLSERTASGVKQLIEHICPGYNIFNTLRKIFNAEATKQQMEKDLIESGRVVKNVPRLVKLPNGQYITGEKLARRQEALRQANQKQNVQTPRPVVVRTPNPVNVKRTPTQQTRPVVKSTPKQVQRPVVKPTIQTQNQNANRTQFLEAERRILLNQFGEQAYYGSQKQGYQKRR